MHIYLTQKGEERATRIYERHCILKEFLLYLGVNGLDAENDACAMEHVISEETFSAIKKFTTKH